MFEKDLYALIASSYLFRCRPMDGVVAAALLLILFSKVFNASSL
jgi:hypothetical protein